MIRPATLKDIPAMQALRLSVNENRLSDPGRITAADYAEMLFTKGRTWLYESSGEVQGFVSLDLSDNNVWALFVHPRHEKKGIGSALHRYMLDEANKLNLSRIWLTTGPDTRAEQFYRMKGWRYDHTTDSGELYFEMPLQ